MTHDTNHKRVTPYELAAWGLTAVTLVLVLTLRLLPALLAGLLIYHLVHALAAAIKIKQLSWRGAKILAVTLISALVITAVVSTVVGVGAFLHIEHGGLSALLAKLADILERSHANFPVWISEAFPLDAENLQTQAATWLREHARELQGIGRDTARTLAHILIGMILGAMVSLQEAVAEPRHTPFMRALWARAGMFSAAFGNIVAAQAKIAATNAFLTWLYLGVALPLFGIKLPFIATLVVVTFAVGLIPVIGNVISNTLIVLVSLGYSFDVAVVSLVFLVAIHKLEYFLNAKIVSSAIKARAWELLMAMLVLEAAFGVAGVMAAPIYYAYLKDELQKRGVI